MAGPLPARSAPARRTAPTWSGRSYVVVSGLTFSGTSIDGIYVSGSDHVTVSGNTVTAGRPAAAGADRAGDQPALEQRLDGVGQHQRPQQQPRHLRLRHQHGQHHRGQRGQLQRRGLAAQRQRHRRDQPRATRSCATSLHDNEDSGINFYTGGNNNLATLNVTYNNGDHGIDDFNVTGGRLIGNTVFHNCTSGINVEGTSGNYTVENNVAVDNAVYPAYNGISCTPPRRQHRHLGLRPGHHDRRPQPGLADQARHDVRLQDVLHLPGRDAGGHRPGGAGVQGDPRFAAPASGDFAADRPAPRPSTAATPGSPASRPVDLLGNPRVDDPATPNTLAAGPRLYDDLGAYELQTGSSAPTARLTVDPLDRHRPAAGHRRRLGQQRPPGPGPHLHLRLR